MHVTRGSTQSVTVLLPYTSANQYPSFGTDSFYAKACRWLAACRRTTERARSEFAILNHPPTRESANAELTHPRISKEKSARKISEISSGYQRDTSEIYQQDISEI
jgi:hypothetical protein